MVTVLRPLAVLRRPTAVVRWVPVRTDVPSPPYLRPLLGPVAVQAGQVVAVWMPL